jgi:hypothetical protein
VLVVRATDVVGSVAAPVTRGPAAAVAEDEMNPESPGADPTVGAAVMQADVHRTEVVGPRGVAINAAVPEGASGRTRNGGSPSSGIPICPRAFNWLTFLDRSRLSSEVSRRRWPTRWGCG